MEKIAKLIIEACLLETSANPIEIFSNIARKDYIRIHGPEHHILDGAAILTAYYNAGGNIDLKSCLEEISKRGLQMPGATCGYWGVCGAVSSIGAALSIIDGTGPLSNEDWGSHMLVTSFALKRLGEIGGPRCCKRDGYIALEEAINYINDHYNVKLEHTPITCTFSALNKQCIGARCPFSK